MPKPASPSRRDATPSHRDARKPRPRRTIERPPMPKRDIADARRAIAAFVDGNIGKFDRWLTEVAEGRILERKEIDAEGVERVVETVVLVEPNPAKAIDLVLKAAEFYVPKLAHTEVDVTMRTPEQDLADHELATLIDSFRRRVNASQAVDAEPVLEKITKQKPGKYQP